MTNKEKDLGWALDNANVTVRVKPRRPYTPYNLFYLLERELLVQDPQESPGLLALSPHPLQKGNLEDELELPSRYKGKIILSPKWYDPDCKEKSKHRKSHGKVMNFSPISFITLCRSPTLRFLSQIIFCFRFRFSNSQS